MGPAEEPRKRARTPVGATAEPVSYDRRFYGRALLAAFIIIAVSAGFVVYNVAFKKQAPAGGVSFDLSSLFMKGPQVLPDARNPCIIIQEHLEATRRGDYRKAYGYLCTGLQSEVPYDRFVDNALSNSLLFRDVSGYSFPDYEVEGTASRVNGYIEYRRGGRSRVEVAFAWEEGGWKVALMHVMFQ